MRTGYHRMFMGDYHIAFTLKAPDAEHCIDCADRAKTRDNIIAHIAQELEQHDEVDLTTPDHRYLTTVSRDDNGHMVTRDRFNDALDDWLDLETPALSRRYNRI